jgi:hypothetical protein
MSSRRIITSIIACLVAVSAALPAAASAGSLLSGYGGPGAGNQAILGSSLLNGGGGPPAGGPGGGGLSTPASGGSSTAGGLSLGTGAGRGGNSRGARSHSSRPGVAVAPVAGTSEAYLARVAASREVGGSDTLGLSGQVLILMLLVLGALIFVGVLTRRMTRAAAAGRHG